MEHREAFWRIKKAIGKFVGVPPQCVLGWSLASHVPNEGLLVGLMQNHLRVVLSACPGGSLLEDNRCLLSCAQKDTFGHHREWDVQLVLLSGSRGGKATRRIFKAVAKTIRVGG